MVVAVLTDIHGNSVALDAVVADARAAGAEEFWLLGDLVAMGPDPIGTADRLMALEPTVSIRGNTDRYVLTGDLAFPATGGQKSLDMLFRITASMAWTRGMLSSADYLPRLDTTVRRHLLDLADGSSLLAVQSNLATDHEHGIDPTISDAELAEQFPGVEAEIVLGGHTQGHRSNHQRHALRQPRKREQPQGRRTRR
jgi:predicted phosphodiesterase